MQNKSKLSTDNGVYEIVEKAIGGDVDAFEEIVKRYSQTILFHAGHIVKDKNSVEDAAQNIIMQMYGSIGSLKEPRAFHAWMHRIIRYTCKNFNRDNMSGVRSMESEFDDDEALANICDDDIGIDPERYAENRQKAEVLYNLITQLPYTYRETIILRYYDDLSYGEIAKTLGVTAATVGSNLIKAKNKLKNMIENSAEASQLIHTDDKDVFCGLASFGAAIHFGADMEVSPIMVKGLVAHMESHIAGWSKSTAYATKFGFNNIFSKAAVKIICGGVSVSAVAVCGVIIALPHNNTAGETTKSVVKSQIAEPAKETKPAQYHADAKIEFTGRNGSDNGYNIVSAKVYISDNTGSPSSWEISNINEEVINRGNGGIIPHEALSALKEGSYTATFTIKNKDGAAASVSREFIIE